MCSVEQLSVQDIVQLDAWLQATPSRCSRLPSTRALDQPGEVMEAQMPGIEFTPVCGALAVVRRAAGSWSFR